MPRTAGEMATMGHGNLVRVDDAGELLRNGQGVMPHFIQAEAKINLSKNIELLVGRVNGRLCEYF